MFVSPPFFGQGLGKRTKPDDAAADEPRKRRKISIEASLQPSPVSFFRSVPCEVYMLSQIKPLIENVEQLFAIGRALSLFTRPGLLRRHRFELFPRTPHATAYSVLRGLSIELALVQKRSLVAALSNTLGFGRAAFSAQFETVLPELMGFSSESPEATQSEYKDILASLQKANKRNGVTKQFAREFCEHFPKGETLTAQVWWALIAGVPQICIKALEVFTSPSNVVAQRKMGSKVKLHLLMVDPDTNQLVEMRFGPKEVVGKGTEDRTNYENRVTRFFLACSVPPPNVSPMQWTRFFAFDPAIPVSSEPPQMVSSFLICSPLTGI